MRASSYLIAAPLRGQSAHILMHGVTGAVDKSKLQIVHLEGASWVNVPTVPDPAPGNPYVSATISMAGTYALIQKP